MMSSLHTLLIAVDTDLSVAFDDLLSTTRTPLGPTIFAHLPSRTEVRAERCTNAVSQTVVLSFQTHEGGGIEEAYVQKATSQGKNDVYAVLLLDVQQVGPLLSVATAHRCPSHPSGAGPLGWYLDAVVEGLVKDKQGSLQSNPEKGIDPDTGSSLSPTASGAAQVNEVAGIVVHLSIIVVPNATSALDGLNSTNTNITTKDASTLFGAAAAWIAAHQLATRHNTVCAGSSELNPGGSCNNEKSTYAATLDLCTTAAQPQQAIQMIAALAHKLLKNWSTSTSAAMPAAQAVDSESRANTASRAFSAAAIDLKDVRPDTQRKCVPTDFHALYTSMLTEVSSFSERKTIAAVTAFPTMCHLLEYVDSVAATSAATTVQETKHQSNFSGIATATALGRAVYNTNYGEQRSWNVLNDAIVEALVTEYDKI